MTLDPFLSSFASDRPAAREGAGTATEATRGCG